MQLVSRLLFAVRHRTLSRVVVSPSDPTMIEVHHEGRVVRMKRRCPHQGAPLEQGYFDGEVLRCPWHGCGFDLAKCAK